MRKNLIPWVGCLAAAVSLASSSCTYDPYYSSAGGYYGDGYGYGSSSFSTSLFVSTGDPRWGYDPHTYCYYDYRSRRYYDPYLYGYYPVGYRPHAVYGAPHPHGWRPGHGHCPPPRTVRNVTVVNYRDRESAYRKSNYSWARQVKSRPSEGTYRKPYLGTRPDEKKKTNYRPDSRYHQTNDRGSYNSRSWSQRDAGSNHAHGSGYQGSHDRSREHGYRQASRPPSQQPVRISPPRQSPRESTRGSSMNRPQSTQEFNTRKTNQGRGHEAPRRQAQPSNPSGKKDNSRGRNPIRGLGDA